MHHEFSFSNVDFCCRHPYSLQIAAPAMLHHIALRTHSPAELADFYVRVCGLVPVVGAPLNAAGPWLSAGGTVIMIEPRAASEPGPTPGALDLLAFQAAQPDLSSVLGFLTEQRVVVEATTQFTAYFRDPDGRRVALSTYRFPAVRPDGN